MAEQRPSRARPHPPGSPPEPERAPDADPVGGPQAAIIPEGGEAAQSPAEPDDSDLTAHGPVPPRYQDIPEDRVGG